jgi:outer membrane protein OmpA-like peptidoglycan-associated protein
MRVRGLTIALLVSTATAAGAQSGGTFEITGFGRYTRFDSTLALQEGASGGASLGFYPIRNLAVEAEAAYTQSHSKVTGLGITNIPLRGRLAFHVPLGGYGTALRIGAGYLHNLYRDNVDVDHSGWTGLVGIRWGLSPTLAFRIDGTADYVRGPDANPTGQYINWGAQVGLGFRVGAIKGGPKDKDRDTVTDKLDSCPNTTAGKTVDANGCAAYQKDADRDGANDELDRCPDTGSGEPVDTEGCSASQKDDDKDGVLNSVDQCAGTPPGENANGSGCAPSQRDEDADGVSDAFDQCPNTPAGEAVNSRGCFMERDTDGDNVPDKRDRCPNTPPGVTADSNGCTIVIADERDTDGDGVPDRRDQCPDTPKGTAANANGCTIAMIDERDSDGDGVPDKRDRCPDTLNGTPADASGCPIAVIDDRDSDGDGVPNTRDICPDTPKNETADAKGCTILFHKGARSVILRGVTFQTGRAVLTPAAREILRDVASQLVENPQYKVQISGHTDNTGTRVKNLRLSLARARTVETFLVANGVPFTQVSAKGFGPDVPIAPNTTAAGRGKNRRVELNRTN